MTTIYFVRHAQSDHTVQDHRARPLTLKGVQDRLLVTEYLQDKSVDAVFSSPFRRAVDTVADFAEKFGLPVQLMDAFAERRVGGVWVENFWDFARQQWADFDYKLADGESLREVQQRNVAGLEQVLRQYPEKTVVIGTYGTALSTVIQHYDPTYNFADFQGMADVMPWVVKMFFVGTNCAGMQKIDLFVPAQWKAPAYNEVSVHELGALCAYRFVVIFAKRQGRWLYCHHKRRDCWETAGGHIEQGESTLEAAQRELYEETGAQPKSVQPLFDYRVHLGSEYSHGQVFLAQLESLPQPPDDFEMAEVRLFDTIPDKMRFPQILPVLFDAMQRDFWSVSRAKDDFAAWESTYWCTHCSLAFLQQPLFSK